MAASSPTDSIMTGSTLDLVALLRNSEHPHGTDKVDGGCGGTTVGAEDHPATPGAVSSRPSRPSPAGVKEEAKTLTAEEDEGLFYLIREPPAAKSLSSHGIVDIDGGADDNSDVLTLAASVTESIGDPLGPDSPNLGDAGPVAERSPSPSAQQGVLTMAVASDLHNSSLLRPPQPCGASMGGITKAVAICVPFAMDDDWRSEDSEPSSPSPMDADGGDDERAGRPMDDVDSVVVNCRLDAAGNCHAIRAPCASAGAGDGGCAPKVAPRSAGLLPMSATSSSDASSERSCASAERVAGASVPASKQPPMPSLPTPPSASDASVRPAIAAAALAAAHPLPPLPALPPVAPTAVAPPAPAAAQAAAAKRPAERTYSHASAAALTAPSTPVRPRGGRPRSTAAGHAAAVVTAPPSAVVAAAPKVAPEDLRSRLSFSRSTCSGAVEGDAAGPLTDGPCMPCDACPSPMPSLCLSPPPGLSLLPSPNLSLSSLVPILCLSAPQRGKVEEVAAATAVAPVATKSVVRMTAPEAANDTNCRRTSPVGGISIPPAPEMRRSTLATSAAVALAVTAEPSGNSPRANASSGPTSSTSLATASVESRPFALVSSSPYASSSSIQSFPATVGTSIGGSVSSGGVATTASGAPFTTDAPRPGPVGHPGIVTSPLGYVLHPGAHLGTHPGAHPGVVSACTVDPRYSHVYSAHGGQPVYHHPPPGAYAMAPMGAPYGVPRGAPYWVPNPAGGAVVYPGAPHGLALGFPGASPLSAEAARNARSDRDKVYVRCVCGHDNHIRRLACSRCARRKEAKPVIKKPSREIARKERAAAAAAAAAAGPPRASTILPRSFAPRSPHAPGAQPVVGVHGLASAPTPAGVPVAPGVAPTPGGWWAPPPGAHGTYPMVSGASPSAGNLLPQHLQHPHAHPPPHSHGVGVGGAPTSAPPPSHPMMVPGGGRHQEMHSQPVGPMAGWSGHSYPYPSALSDISAAAVASVAASRGGSPPS